MKMKSGTDPITKKEIKNAAEILKSYRNARISLDNRIRENEKWFKGRHWDIIRNSSSDKNENIPEPTSAWLFNSLMNKHADAMDHYPEPVILPREKSDEADARALSDIVPVILERNGFEDIYSKAWWSKLKTGTACYGVFWDSSAENGMGDIAIKEIDLLKIYFEPEIENIQDSRNLFIIDTADADLLVQMYPQLYGKSLGGPFIADFSYAEDRKKAVVVDWYYKKNNGINTVVHLCKFCGDEILYSTENPPVNDYPDLRETGIYDHGMYPIIFDTLFPEKGSPVGFGYLDICKSPQMFIDKLNQIVLINASLSGKKRFLLSETAGINEEELADWSNDIIHVSGSIDDRYFKELEVSSLPQSVLGVMQMKIEELKETSGNRDIQQGSISGGVTAAAAISALQEAGSKLSRDMIKGCYSAHTKIISIIIELIRQFYDFGRYFRIEGDGGAMKYIEYSNYLISNERRPVFDIKISAQKKNPFSRMAQDELAKTLFSAGFFNPQIAEQALIALDMMSFEGKEKVMEKVRENAGLTRNSIPYGKAEYTELEKDLNRSEKMFKNTYGGMM